MPRFLATALSGARLRAAPHFTFVAPDRLAVMPGSSPPADAPRSAGRREHLVAPDTAALFRSLARPKRLPIAPAQRRAMARLILDGLIEIEDRGRFLSGPDACSVLFEGGPARPRGVIGRLSRAAVEYAADVAWLPPASLSGRLYRYNARPASPAWRRRLPDERAVRRFLDLERPAPRARRSSRTAAYMERTWYAWDVSGARTPAVSAPRFKLYLSPEPAETPAACAALRGLLGRPRGPFAMKVGRELPSLLRPDRLIAYFARHDDLIEASVRLRRSLDGMPAQGVPFTAGLGADGLLSWGADLPATSSLGTDASERSWRAWVVTRLARALHHAFTAAVANPVDFALIRISLDGVDAGNWAPTAGLLRVADGMDFVDADR